MAFSSSSHQNHWIFRMPYTLRTALSPAQVLLFVFLWSFCEIKKEQDFRIARISTTGNEIGEYFVALKKKSVSGLFHCLNIWKVKVCAKTCLTHSPSYIFKTVKKNYTILYISKEQSKKIFGQAKMCGWVRISIFQVTLEIQTVKTLRDIP